MSKRKLIIDYCCPNLCPNCIMAETLDTRSTVIYCDATKRIIVAKPSRDLHPFPSFCPLELAGE